MWRATRPAVSRPMERSRIPGVASGTYIFSAKTPAEAFATRVLVRRPLPLNRLQVRGNLNPGVEVAGQVVLTIDAAIDLRRARVVLSETMLSLPDPEPAVVAQAGRFVFKAHFEPGVYALNVADLPEDLYLNAAVQSGADILESLIFPSAGVPRMLEALSLFKSGAMAVVLRARFFDQSNTPSVGALVTLVPEGNARSRPDRYRTAITGPDGSFAIRGIAPRKLQSVRLG